MIIHSHCQRAILTSQHLQVDRHVVLADAVIMNYDTSIGQLFQAYGPDKDILFSKDYSGSSIINAGAQSFDPQGSAACQTTSFRHTEGRVEQIHAAHVLPQDSALAQDAICYVVPVNIQHVH